MTRTKPDQEWTTTDLVYRGQRLPGRLVLAPINTGFASNGHPTQRLLTFHQERAGPPIVIAYVGNVASSQEVATNSGTVILEGAGEALARIADIIAGTGTLPGIQLADSPTLAPRRSWRTYDIRSEVGRLSDIVSSLRADDLKRSLAGLERSVSVAAGLGFKVIQLHAAHGYLLSLLLARRINRRRDSYRVLGPALSRLLDRARDAAPTQLLSLRFNLLSGIAPEAEELLDSKEVATVASSHGFDILDLSAGIYTADRRLIYPGSIGGGMPYLRAGLEMADRHPDRIVTITGNLTDVRELSRLPENVAIGVARALIADPRFGEKSAHGDQDSIVRCARTNRCHYFSRGRPHIECGVNADLGNEEAES